MKIISTRRKGESLSAYRKRCEKYVEKVRVTKPIKQKNVPKSQMFMLFSVVEAAFIGLGYLIFDSYGFQWAFAGQFIGVSIFKALIGLFLWRVS